MWRFALATCVYRIKMKKARQYWIGSIKQPLYNMVIIKSQRSKLICIFKVYSQRVSQPPNGYFDIFVIVWTGAHVYHQPCMFYFQAN